MIVLAISCAPLIRAARLLFRQLARPRGLDLAQPRIKRSAFVAAFISVSARLVSFAVTFPYVFVIAG